VANKNFSRPKNNLCYIEIWEFNLNKELVMDISGASNISALSGQAAGQATGDAVSLQVLKKAMDMQAQSAAALIDALPQPAKASSANMPAHLGQNVNTTA
jgi:hypothetical protein